jgi:hypothetical protein
MADTGKRTAERVKQYLLLLALVMAGVLAVVGVLWADNRYAIGRCSYGFFSYGFYAQGVFSVGIVSVGVFSVGIVSFGLFSLGLLSVALLLGWPWCWCLMDRLLKRHSVRRSIALVALVGVCAGGLMHLLSQTVLRDYLDRQIGHATYSSEYVEENRGKVIVEIPEVYELANVIIAVSDHGQSGYQVHREGEYYERVMEHFGPHSGHRVVDEQVFGRSFSRYLGFRTNSYCYVFDADRIRLDGIHWKAAWSDTFQARRHLVEDFARTSKFRRFYRANMPYYQEQIDKYRREVPIKQMWQWLEERFPERFDCYRVVLSPLISGTHNTQDFAGGAFREAVMFVAMGPILEGEIDDEKRMQAARIVFTEIDHNYVNPVTDRFARRVNKVFADFKKWNEQKGYSSPEMTFNEYMTWALFTLYAYDNYEKKDFEIINDKMIKQMVNSRKFVLFEQFDEKLLALYLARQERQTIPDLYQAILDWAEKYK